MRTAMFFPSRFLLSSSIVLGAIVATAAVFVFARPEYRPPGEGKPILPPSYVALAERGWTWPHGLPGFRIGHDEGRWNFSAIRWADLSGLRLAARGAGVDPQSLRVLDAARLQPRVRPYLLVAGREAQARTCIGAQVGPAAPRFFCRAELAGRAAVVIASPQPQLGSGWSIWIGGVVSADVQRVTVETVGATWTDMRSGTAVVHPDAPLAVFERRGNRTWGTFSSYHGQPVPWHAKLVFYGEHGKIATLPLRFRRPGQHVYLR